MSYIFIWGRMQIHRMIRVALKTWTRAQNLEEGLQSPRWMTVIEETSCLEGVD